MAGGGADVVSVRVWAWVVCAAIAIAVVYAALLHAQQQLAVVEAESVTRSAAT